MLLEDLKNIKPTRTTTGRPSDNLTDKEWQQQLAFKKLYITPYDKKHTRMGGKYSRECTKTQNHSNEDKIYDGVTNWQSYCSYINDVLKNIRSGGVDYCYFAYQIFDLLKFHYNDLKTKYHDGYWEVWLERGVKC